MFITLGLDKYIKMRDSPPHQETTRRLVESEENRTTFMKLRRRRVAEFHTLQCDDTGQTDTCELDDEESYPQHPGQTGLP